MQHAEAASAAMHDGGTRRVSRINGDCSTLSTQHVPYRTALASLVTSASLDPSIARPVTNGERAYSAVMRSKRWRRSSMRPSSPIRCAQTVSILATTHSAVRVISHRSGRADQLGASITWIWNSFEISKRLQLRHKPAVEAVKAGTKETGSAFTLLEWTAPVGFAPPPHTHHVEDEAFFILEGSMTVTCGDKSWEVGPGSFVFLPHGVIHGFTVTGDGPIRGLQLTVPSGFEGFITEAGEPAGAPASGAPDVQKLLAAATRHNIEIKAPPADQ